jgi:CheY-like chemotaxis protein
MFMPRVLVIDDDPDYLESIRVMLDNLDFEVDTARDPDEGIRKVDLCDPDIVVLDMMMPDRYEGFAVTRHIRQTLGRYHLPIIMLSSIHTHKKIPYRLVPDREHLPVDAFLDKPVERDDLIDTIRRLLGTRHVGEPPISRRDVDS